MKRWFWLLLMLMPARTWAIGSITGFCESGNQKVMVSGLASSTIVQRSYPLCTISVYTSGTITLATIYSDSNSTPLGNPFTANTNGSWQFFAANGNYDIVKSGSGIPTATISGSIAFDPASNSQYLGVATTNTHKANLEVGGEVTLNAGDAVKLFCKVTSAGATPESDWCINSNNIIPSGMRTGPTYSYEADIDNNDSDVSYTSNPPDQVIPLIAICGGMYKCLIGVATRSSTASDRFLAAFDAQNFSLFGYNCGQSSASPAVTGPCFHAQPSSDGSNLLLEFVNAAGNADTWRVLQSGVNQIANNIPYQAADTGGTYRNWFLSGGDQSYRFYAGNSGNGLLVLQDGTSEFQWNSQGITSQVKATFNGVVGNGSALKTGSVAGCTPSAGAGNSCPVTITWTGTAFADGSYIPNCTITGATNVGFTQITAKAAGTMTVIEVNGSASALSGGNVECTAIHP